MTRRLPIAPLSLLTVSALLVCGCGDSLAHVVGVTPIAPQELSRRLATGERLLLVDVREATAFASGHVPGARSVARGGLDAFFASTPSSRPVVALCEEGLDGVAAAAVARGHGHDEALVLSGGVEAWRAAGLALERGAGEASPSAPPPRRPFSHLAQILLVVAAFGAKPLYMLIAALVGIILWRARTRGSDLRALLWAVACFEAGETACLLNYLLARETSEVLELIHMLGMVGLAALLPSGFFLMVDQRVLRLTDEHAVCLGQRFCGRCWKRDAGPCPPRQLWTALCPTLALVAALPLSLPLRADTAVVWVLGTEVQAGASLFQELVQFRVFPALGVVLAIGAFALLVDGGPRGARAAPAPFFLAVGFATFSLARFFLVRSFARQPLWADTWEELTELAVIGTVAALLWWLRRALGLVTAPHPSATSVQER